MIPDIDDDQFGTEYDLATSRSGHYETIYDHC